MVLQMKNSKQLICEMKKTLLELLKDEEAKEKNVKKEPKNTESKEIDYFMNLYNETGKTTLKEKSVKIKNIILNKIKK